MAGGGVQALYRKNWLPNYGVFDEQRYFQAGEKGAVVDLGGVARRADRVRGHLGARAAGVRRGDGGGDADRQRVGVAVLRRQGPPARVDGRSSARATTWRVRVLQHGRRPGRADLRRPLAAGRPRGRRDRPRAAVRRGARRRVGRPAVGLHRAPARDAAAPAGPQRAARGERRRALRAPGARRRWTGSAASRRAAGPGVRGLRRARARRARLRREERLRARRARPLGRDRLDARGAGRGRRARAPTACTCVTMPSRYSSEGTRSDAKVLADNLGVRCSRSRSRRAWRPTTRCSPRRSTGREPDITEENLQARIRGNLLMALSNKFGWLVLTTGNKSETSVGYSTLYGDTAGGFAVIKDVPKTLVYRLVDVRNARDGEHPVPQSIVDRPPSAELRAGPAGRRLAARLRHARPRSSRPTSRRTPTASACRWTASPPRTSSA